MAAEAHLASLDPRDCRRHVAAHFSTTRMTSRYADVYREVISDHQHHYGGSPECVPVEMRP